MDKIYVGYLSSPVGLKGEIKVLSDTNYQDIIFKKGNILYINDQKYQISSSRYHKKNYIISFESYNDINKLDELLKKDIYILKEDVGLKEDEYLYIELIEMQIISDIGHLKINDILLSGTHAYFKCGNVIIPYNEKYIEKVDKENKIIYAKNVGELRI